MIGWILAVLALFFVQTLLPNVGAGGLAATPEQRAYLRGNRDRAPPPTVMSGRMERALANMFEALPVFLPLAVLAVATGASDRLGAHRGGGVLLRAGRLRPGLCLRIAPLRSLVWAVGHVGLVMMWSDFSPHRMTRRPAVPHMGGRKGERP